MADTPPPTPGAEPTAAPTALPPVAARIIAFVAIVLAGAAGGFIGWAFVDLQTEGDATVATALGGLVGAALAAVGVGVVTVLALRAMNEWRTLQARGGPTPPAGRQRRADPRATRQPPRVR